MPIIIKCLWRRNSVNIDAREMKRIPLDSSWWDESNSGKIIEIGSLDRAPIPIIIKYLWRRNSINIDAREMIRISWDSSWWDESNGSKIIKIGSLGAELSAISYGYTDFVS